MMRLQAALAAGLCAMAVLAQAQPASSTVIYPAKGQSAKQLDRDKYECHDWARGQTGYDPTQPSAPPQGSPSQTAPVSSAEGLVKGAAGGAALGELVNDDAGRGAAIGVLGAGMRERAKQMQATQAKQQQAAQQQAARNQQRTNYGKAFGACMEGRDYVVK